MLAHVLLLASVFLLGPLRPLAPLGQAAPAADLAELVSRYRTDRDDLRRFHDLPLDEATWARREAFLDEWQRQVEALEPSALGLHAKVDRVLLLAELKGARADLALERQRHAEIAAWLPFAEAILGLERERRTLASPEPQTAAGALAPLAKSIDELRERVLAQAREKHADAPSPVLALRAAEAVGRLRRVLDEWHGFYAEYDPTFSWWTDVPKHAVARALEAYEDALRKEVAGQKGEAGDPLVGDPIGREALLSDLEAEAIAYSPEELIAIGERELAWCEARMAEAAEELGFQGDWKKALERVKQDHVPPGEQDDLVATQAREAIEFLRARDLVTIPPLCEELWRLSMLSAEGQKTLPFAAYSGQRMDVAYPTRGMSHEDKLMSMRGNNRAFSRIVTPHELIPGHHLQSFMAARHRPYRRTFYTPFLVEGWALHWEMELWDEGYPRTPEERIGMLFWRMHRCARILVSLRFHLGETTPQQMIDFLVDRIGHERFGATSEVRRYIGGAYSPLYQCGYMIGGLQLRALEAELKQQGWTQKRFHDAVLELGPIPIERIRDTLLEQEPAERAGWRF